MRKFNRLFIAEKTKVKFNGKWYLIKEVHETRKWVKLHGLEGSFQREHFTHCTNKTTQEPG